VQKHFIVLFLTLTPFFQPLLAGIVPGRWEKVEALPAGSAIIVYLESGDRILGSFNRLEANSLTLTDLEGKSASLPRQGIRKITSPERTDKTMDGTLIGLAVGFGAGAAVGAASADRLDLVKGGAIVSFGAIGAGVGALAGWIIDDTRKNEEVYYRSP
jgi:hypothetical protein